MNAVLKMPTTLSHPPLAIPGMVSVKKAVKLSSKKLLMSLQKKKKGALKDVANMPRTLTQPLLNISGMVTVKKAVNDASKKLLMSLQKKKKRGIEGRCKYAKDTDPTALEYLRDGDREEGRERCFKEAPLGFEIRPYPMQLLANVSRGWSP